MLRSVLEMITRHQFIEVALYRAIFKKCQCQKMQNDKKGISNESLCCTIGHVATLNTTRTITLISPIKNTFSQISSSMTTRQIFCSTKTVQTTGLRRNMQRQKDFLNNIELNFHRNHKHY